ncbi:SAC3/GANP/Nin1/mts3/eIF-3 p25 family-domain-containing protein [Gaertneriomyces semiglobifer]|nr:SAC3/GANP/Nin1/mts3/eIF-3 p25 family-domain-containing protein [Gaertneriomyces semiglobifer]
MDQVGSQDTSSVFQRLSAAPAPRGAAANRARGTRGHTQPTGHRGGAPGIPRAGSRGANRGGAYPTHTSGFTGVTGRGGPARGGIGHSTRGTPRGKRGASSMSWTREGYQKPGTDASASTEHTPSSAFTATNYSTPHRTAFFNATQPTGGTASSFGFGNNESIGSGSLMDEHGMDVDGSRNDAIAMDEQQGSSVFLKPNQPSAFGSSPNGPSIFAALASQKSSPMNTPIPRAAATSFQQSPSALVLPQQTNSTFSSTPPPSTSAGEQTKQSRADRFASNPSNNRYMELKAKRPGLMAKYIAEGKMDDPNKKYRLEDARDFVGECMDMCPEFERHEREYQKGLMEFEKIEGTDRVDHARAVKRYRRSAADDERPMPCDVRPPPVLMHTLDYLVHELLPQYDLHRTYGFIRDRTRAIRKDLTLQNVRGPEAIAIYERIARYHLLCSHRLCEVIDTQQEYEQLEKSKSPIS